MKRIILIEIIAFFILLSVDVYSQGFGNCPFGNYPFGHCENTSTNESQQPSQSSYANSSIDITKNNYNITPVINYYNITNLIQNTTVVIRQYKFVFTVALTIFGLELISIIFLKTEVIFFIVRKIHKKFNKNLK